MIPDRSGLLAEIDRLQKQKKLREAELNSFLDQVRHVRKELEDIDARLKSKWAVYNKFYRNEEKKS